MKLTELPTDVIVLLFPYLEIKEFLALCSSCKALQVLNHDSLFWRERTTSTFRLPNRPSAPNDGELWKKLHKRLSTQTKVYLWGQHPKFRGWNSHNYTPSFPPEYGPPKDLTNIFELPLDTRRLGAVADLQIGGWSTTLLTNKGDLYTVGSLNSEAFDQMSQETGFKKLNFQYADESVERTSISQFSVGRKVVLGLSDDKTIYLWYNNDRPALEMRFPALMNEHDVKASRVVCGWNHNSVSIPGQGIVVWPNITWRVVEKAGDDNLFLQEFEPHFGIVDRSAFNRSSGRAKSSTLHSRADDDSIEDGEVTSHILLENILVFTTDTGRIFVSRYPQFPNRTVAVLDGPAEMVKWPPSYEITDVQNAREVQGSFRSFGVFTHDNQVLIFKQSQVEEWLEKKEDNRTVSEVTENRLPLIVIPALQNTGVIQLAFGDYHFHALHSDGSITSYDSDPEHCGALGLTKARGILRSGNNGKLLPHGYINGRKIWFHQSQNDFAKAQEANPRFEHLATQRLVPQVLNAKQAAMRSEVGEFSEWMEQMGSDWHKWPEVAAINEDGLAPYFALSVAAGGWSSGAVMLVNEDVALKIQEVYESQWKEKLGKPVNVKLGGDKEWNTDAGEVMPWKKDPPRFGFLETQDPFGEVFGLRGSREL